MWTNRINIATVDLAFWQAFLFYTRLGMDTLDPRLKIVVPLRSELRKFKSTRETDSLLKSNFELKLEERICEWQRLGGRAVDH